MERFSVKRERDDESTLELSKQEQVDRLVARAEELGPNHSEGIYPPPLTLGAYATVDCDYWGADYRKRLRADNASHSPDSELRKHTDADAAESFELLVELTKLALEGSESS